MAPIDDESVLAYTAVRDLSALYGAYRATSLAHLKVLERLAAQNERDEELATDERLAKQQALTRRAAAARESQAVIARRAAQLELRMRELRDLTEPS